MSLCRGVAGLRGGNPIGIFIHNDAGSQNANAAFYRGYLQQVNLENGFAHYYVAQDGILQAEEDYNQAWHCGDWNGNKNFLSIEICQSKGNENIFKQNEEKALQLAAEKCKKYGIVPNASTIRLHREVYATSCPHRSVDIHGGANGAKQYFINRIRHYMGMSTDVKVDKVTQTIDKTPANNMSATAEREIHFRYAVMIEGGTKLPFVTNLEDFAGIQGRKIIGACMGVDKGSIEYEGHQLGGKWLGKVTGCDWNDYNNGYAGNGTVLDLIRTYYKTPSWYATKYGYRQAQYRVSPVNKTYYPWQYDYDVNKEKNLDGFAGAQGVAIDRFQLF